jgi:anti-sigma B factor antagonist
MTTIEPAVRISIGCEDDVAVLTVAGHLDVDTAPTLRDGLAALDPMRSNVVVDLTDVHFVDSAGVNVLAWATCRFAEHGRRLVVRGTSARTAEILTMGGLFDHA